MARRWRHNSLQRVALSIPLQETVVTGQHEQSERAETISDLSKYIWFVQLAAVDSVRLRSNGSLDTLLSINNRTYAQVIRKGQ